MPSRLRTEIGSDPSVQTLVFYNILYERANQGVDVSRIQVSLARQPVPQ